MARELTGKANHVWEGGDIATLDICECTLSLGGSITCVTIGSNDHGGEITDGEGGTINIAAGASGDSIMVHSLDQWKQVDALVRKAFDNLAG